MIRKSLKSYNLADAEFKTVMAIATEDIKFNRIGFKKKTSLNDVLIIAIESTLALRRC